MVGFGGHCRSHFWGHIDLAVQEPPIGAARELEFCTGIMSTAPPQPREALEPGEYQRFMYACSHERHSPTTRRLIDASSYGWVHRFIQTHGEDAEAPPPPGDAWLDTEDADPGQLGDYFGRVAIRLRNTPGYHLAIALQVHYQEEAEAIQIKPLGFSRTTRHSDESA